MEARINEEAERATHYLDESTEARIVEVELSLEYMRTVRRGIETHRFPFYGSVGCTVNIGKYPRPGRENIGRCHLGGKYKKEEE